MQFEWPNESRTSNKRDVNRAASLSPPCRDLIGALEVITFAQGGNLAAHVAFGSIATETQRPRYAAFTLGFDRGVCWPDGVLSRKKWDPSEIWRIPRTPL